MAAPYHTIEEKVSQAVSEALQAAVTTTGWNLYETLDDGNLNYPLIAIICPGAEVTEDRTGNYLAAVEVRVVSEVGQTTKAAHNAMVGLVRDWLIGCMDDLPADINAEAPTDFTAIGWTPLSVSAGVNDDDEQELRVSSTEGVLLCMPS